MAKKKGYPLAWRPTSSQLNVAPYRMFPRPAIMPRTRADVLFRRNAAYLRARGKAGVAIGPFMRGGLFYSK